MMEFLRQVRLVDLVDILLVTLVVHRGLILIRGTRAVPLIKGLAVIFFASLLSNFLGLRTIHWLIQQAITVILVALPIVFYPELRRTLEQIGKGGLFRQTGIFSGRIDRSRTIQEVVRAAVTLARSKTGALIVIEQKIGLSEFLETGTAMDALVHHSLLVTVFDPHTPLHDGAVIIREDRIVAAGVFLPLSERPNISKSLGTRHRAALGISEQSDAVVVVVSEETGTISLAENGEFERYLDEDKLRTRLLERFGPTHEGTLPFWSRR